MSESCFHCGEKIPANTHWIVLWKEVERAMCCPGCQSVCETIISSGLEEYYLLRETKPGRPAALIPQQLQKIASFNQDVIAQAYISSSKNSLSANFYISGMSCAACAWLIEKQLSKLPFIETISVNAVSNLAQIIWQKDSNTSKKNSHLGDILSEISACGYEAKPLLPEQMADNHAAEQKDLLKRLGVAGLGMIQVMMFAIGLYTGAFQGMDPKYQNLLRWVSLIVATPVIFYSAAPFFKVAWHNIRVFKLGMNVPVALAIAAAYSLSSIDTIIGSGDIYFDSAVMFTFFLLLGRFLQSRARWRASETNLSTTAPMSPTIQVAINHSQSEKRWQFKAVSELQRGDVILVPPGEVIPVDGEIVQGCSEVNTAVVNGEFAPHLLSEGQTVLAGSLNQTQPLEIKSTALGADRFIEKLSQKQQQALAAKPAVISLADEFAHRFVLFVLVAAISTAIYWSLTDPENAFWITLSLLVVTCPCALSLATPAAMTAAISHATGFGMLITKPQLLEKLARCHWVVFDKTGTLTLGRLEIEKIESLHKAYSTEKIIHLAAQLEQGFSHPIAKAVLSYKNELSGSELMPDNLFNSTPQISTRSLKNIPGKGVSALINGIRFSLGQFPEFALDEISLRNHNNNEEHNNDVQNNNNTFPASQKIIYLYQDTVAVAKIIFQDPWRTDAFATIAALKIKGFKIAILTGDPAINAANLQKQFQADEVRIGCSAADKQHWVMAKQQQNEIVLMLGDGINDAPVLAQSDISVAMAESVSLSRNESDATLLNQYLINVVKLINLSKRTTTIIKQNLIWAILYNSVTIPLAAMGEIPPWLAAAGMSFSSLFVVLNALRLNRSLGV